MTVKWNQMGMTEGDQESFSRSLLLQALQLRSETTAATCPYDVLTVN